MTLGLRSAPFFFSASDDSSSAAATAAACLAFIFSSEGEVVGVGYTTLSMGLSRSHDGSRDLKTGIMAGPRRATVAGGGWYLTISCGRM